MHKGTAEIPELL